MNIDVTYTGGSESYLIPFPYLEKSFVKVEVNEKLESKYKGLYIIGDGSGITHSLSHASASGVHVARSIAKV